MAKCVHSSGAGYRPCDPASLRATLAGLSPPELTGHDDGGLSVWQAGAGAAACDLLAMWRERTPPSERSTHQAPDVGTGAMVEIMVDWVHE